MSIEKRSREQPYVATPRRGSLLYSSTVRFRLLLPLTIAAIGLTSFAETRTWTGGGDGVNWSDGANWGGTAPSAGATLVISNTVSGTTLNLTNDLGSAETPISIGGIVLGGAGAIRISGNPVSPSTAHAGTFILTACGGEGAITDFDILFPNHTSDRLVYFKTEDPTWWTHNGRIVADGKTRIFLQVLGSSAEHGQNFYGDISVANAEGSVDVFGAAANSRVHFYGKVSVTRFNGKFLTNATGTSYGAQTIGITTFYNPSNEFTAICAAYLNNIKAGAAEVFGSGAELVGGWTMGGSNFDIGTYDQTVSKISVTGSVAAIAGRSITGNGSTLTIKATESFSCDYKYDGSMNVVWDPVGEYTYTGGARTHATSGKITVKRGTMAFQGATTFSNLSEIEIAAGAKFSLAETTTAAPLPSVKTIWLENGTTCKFALPENSSVANVVVFAGGVPLAAGTYTGAGGTADHVVGWIEGKGVVTVVAPTERYFTGANSSRWSDPENWSKGSLPANDVETIIAGLNVTVPSGEDVIYDLASFPNAANVTTPTFTVRRGGGVTVSGGSLVITNICGKARIGGDDASVTSRLEVTSGFLGMYLTGNTDKDYSSSFAIGQNGVLSMTNGYAEYYFRHRINSGLEWMFHLVDGGTLDLSGGAEFVTWMSGHAPVFGTGMVDVRGDAILHLKTVSGSTPSSYWSPFAANESLEVNLSENAKILSTCPNNYIGGVYAGTKTFVRASGNAVVALGPTAVVGRGYETAYVNNSGAYSELDISGNAVVSNTYYSIAVGANGSAAAVANGKIKMSGGTLLMRSASPSGNDLNGLRIGYDSSRVGFTDFYNRGSVELSGGIVSNNTTTATALVAGYGNSYGELIQSGGTFLQGTAVARIGWFGGTGLYRFTGGTADFSQCDFIVGADSGKGTLEIGAGSGTFTSKKLNLAGSDATLKFKLGADGSLATLNVTGTFTVASGAKLVVDTSDYTGNEPVTLMTFAGKDGDFADEDISVIEAGEPTYCIKQSGGKLALCAKSKGFMLIIR